MFLWKAIKMSLVDCRELHSARMCLRSSGRLKSLHEAVWQLPEVFEDQLHPKVLSYICRSAWLSVLDSWKSDMEMCLRVLEMGCAVTRLINSGWKYWEDSISPKFHPPVIHYSLCGHWLVLVFGQSGLEQFQWLRESILQTKIPDTEEPRFGAWFDSAWL